MAGFDVSFIAKATGAPVSGASVVIEDANGNVIATTERAEGVLLVRDAAFMRSLPAEGAARGLYAVAEKLEPGSYSVIESSPPYIEVQCEDVDGSPKILRKAFALGAPLSVTIGEGDARTFIIEHEGPVDEDAEGRQDGRIRSLARSAAEAARHPRSAIARARHLLNRSHELTAGETVTVSRMAAIAACATGAAYLWLAAPFVAVCSMTVAAIGEPGYGLAFAAANLQGYVSRFLLDGWRAVGLLAEAHPWAAAYLNGGAVVALAMLPLAAWPAIGWFAKRLVPANPILDELPEPAGHGEKGTARVVTDRKTVESALPTRPADVAPARDTGMYVGYYQAHPLRRMAACVMNDTAAAAGAAFRRRPQERPCPPRRQPAGAFVHLKGDEHTLILGDTRSGKTRRLLLSTIDLVMSDPGESAIIFDPKGELYGLTAPTLEERGVECIRIDFRNPAYSSRWNMATLAIEAWEAGDAYKCVRLVNEIVSAIAPPLPNEGPSKYFNDGARAYIRSMLLYIISDKTCPRNQKTLTTVSRLVETYGPAMALDPDKPAPARTFVPYEEMLDRLPAVDHPAAEAFSAARNANDKERKAFCSTAQTMLSMFRDPALANMTSETDKPFEDIGRKRQAVYLIVPDNKEAYQPFATMFLKQAYSTLADLAVDGSDGGVSGRLPQRVNFICEELCSIPKWDGLNTAVNIAGGRGIRFFLVVQNKALFEAKYEDDAQGIIGNCNNKVFIKTGDSDNTAKWLSDYIGSYTIRVESTSLSGGRFSPVRTHKSTAIGLEQRKALYPDEIVRWKADYGSIVITGDHPYVVPLPDVSCTPTQETFGLGDLDHNLRKQYETLFGAAPRCEDPLPKWFPELSKMCQGVAYSDSKRRFERKRYLKVLANHHKGRMARRNADPDDEPRQMQGAVFDPGTGEGRLYGAVDAAYVQSLVDGAHKGWMHKETASIQEAQEWLRWCRTRAKADAIGKRARCGEGRTPSEEDSRPSAPNRRRGNTEWGGAR